MPLQAYADNIESIAQQLLAAGAQQVLLMTPPPVWEGAPQARGPDEVSAAAGVVWCGAGAVPSMQARSHVFIIVSVCRCVCAQTRPNRTYNTTATYAAAVRSAAAKLSLPLLDVWRLFESTPGWQQQLLGPDGLHLSSPAGQAAVSKGLMALIDTQLPQLR